MAKTFKQMRDAANNRADDTPIPTWAAVTDGLAPGAANGELTIYGRVEASLGHTTYPLVTGGTASVVTTGTPTVNTAGNMGQLITFKGASAAKRLLLA